MPARKKSLTELKVAGAIRPGRHANRGNVPHYSGVPICPAHLKGESRKFWDTYVPQLIEAGTVTALDTPILIMAAETWGLYRKAVESAERLPPGESSKSIALGYSRQVAELFKRLGMSPQDRQRLVIVPPEEKPLPGLNDFARKRS